MAQGLSHRRVLDVGAIGLDVEDLPPWEAGPVDLKGWFGLERRDLPLELEIGSGKGTFLVQQAAGAPQVNYIGIEYARPYWRHAADRCRRNGLANVRMVHAEAGCFFRHHVPDDSLHEVHVYFPDPWPKARHHKRRLIQAAFLHQVHAKLEPAALIRIVTDHDGYFEWIRAAATEAADRFEIMPYEAPQSAAGGELAGTNFERKYLLRAKAAQGLLLRRV
jgi:tRNA (guanine-N7-)-methyltransferase